MDGDTIILDGKNFISSRRAASLTGYTKDYIGQLSRASKIVARLVGRNWYIDEESLMAHKEEGRRSKQEIDTERQKRQERLMKELSVKQYPVSSFSVEPDARPNIPTLTKVVSEEERTTRDESIPISIKRDPVPMPTSIVKSRVVPNQGSRVTSKADKGKKLNLMYSTALVVVLFIAASTLFSVLESNIVYDSSGTSSSLQLVTISYTTLIGFGRDLLSTVFDILK